MSMISAEHSREAQKEQVVKWRRHFHENPELSFQEEKTSQFIYDTLLSFGNLKVSRPTKTSVMAKLFGQKPGKVLAIRADIDALPIQEENDFPFASKTPGVMHACGHDGHAAMLLGACKALWERKDELSGEIRFLFQHAEELTPGGAEEMVEAGVMEGVDAVIGTHLWSPLQTGKIGIIYGPMMASPDTFTITVKGRGGHAGLPYDCIDSVVIAAQVISNLQHIVSRTTDTEEKLVLSVSQIAGGTAHNVLPDEVKMVGTVRSFNQELRESIPGKMESIIKGITSAHGAEYEFDYEYGYRPVINEESVTRFLHETAEELYGNEGVALMKPSMVGEDFSAFLQKADGCFFFTGAGNKEKNITYPHHHAKFTVDEDALDYGVSMFVRAAIKMLGSSEAG
ncbi:amidohydrolase [Metabacillus sp. GX 13764]|uniref:amidohydrolase n=1 Tax=Metabacillus kandeliae TaxID=2900151 RepID=UPI001E5CFA3A|nr:amidohydrolase [Metabacillus kandeliae]MCD7035578.1 amidohydrolase [Metabacillus kandeliae]